MHFIKFFFLGLILFLFQSCSTQKLGRIALSTIKPSYNFSLDSFPSPPNYAELDSWFLYQNGEEQDADVFFIHPTTYLSELNWNQPLTDSVNLAKTRRKSIGPQALLFDSIANIFAPKYRQATFYSFVDKDTNGTIALDYAYQDVKNAFLHYIQYENSGRPIIIAGHSQGTYHALRLLKEKQVQDLIGDRLIVAYLIGWPVTTDDIDAMPYSFCTDSTSLACITSWNTQKKGNPTSMKSFADGGVLLSNNPLNWTSEEVYVDRMQNDGAMLLKGDSLIFRKHYIGAQNHKGILAIKKPKNKKELGIRRFSSNYHVYDYAFFYTNIKENGLLRKKSFLKLNQ